MYKPNDAYIYNVGQDLIIGTSTIGKVIKFHTDGILSGNTRMTIDISGVTISGTTKILNVPVVSDNNTKLIIDNGTLSQVTGYTVNTIVVPGIDHTVSGFQISLVASGLTNFGDVGYINNLGTVSIASASAIANANAVVMCADLSISANTSGNWLLFGTIRHNVWSWISGGTGGTIYLSTSGTTNNTLTQTIPSGTNNVIQIIGIALNSNVMYFKPELVQVEHI